MTEPNALAPIATQRALAPYGKDNMRYVPTLEEQVAMMRAVTIEQIRELHAEQLGATHGEVTAVGDFDPERIAELCDAMFAGWESSVPHGRIPSQAQEAIPGKLVEIETPDKANAVYYGSMQIKMRDDHPDYPALVVANYVMGGGAMSSRLGKRVRVKESLSYGVGSGLNSHPVDERTTLTLFAISSPDNKERLVQVINEEMEMLLNDGITEEELASAKQGILQSSQLGRTQDGNLAGLLVGTIFAGRDMSYYDDYETRVDSLTVSDVNAALRKYIDPSRLVVHIAGDFANSASSND
jgi:zinc protease